MTSRQEKLLYSGKKSPHYREKLGRFVGHEVVFEASNFEVRETDRENGLVLVILRDIDVINIAGKKVKGSWHIDHLWVKLNEKNARYMTRYGCLARKLRVKGRIELYTYKDSGDVQAGVTAAEVSIRKYKKDIARRYKLNPGQMLSERQMEEIVKEILWQGIEDACAKNGREAANGTVLAS